MSLSFDVSEYRPTFRGQRSLFTPVCRGCPAQRLCGEAFTDSACGADKGTAPRHAHPLRGSTDLKQLESPQRGFTWCELPPLGSYLHVVASRTWARPGEAVSLAQSLAEKPRSSLDPGVWACMIGRDSSLEKLWGKHGELPSRLVKNGFAAVISPGFSTWHNVPPLDGLYSVSKTMAVASILSRDLPTIPTIVWRTGRDIQRQLDWLGLTSSASPTFAADLAPRSEAHFRWMLAGVRLAAKLVAGIAGVRLVAIGVSRQNVMEAIADAWRGPITFASSAAYHRSTHGVLITDGGRGRSASPLDKHDVMKENVARLNGWADEVLATRRLAPAA